jgi:protein-disulfide isomerase
MKHKKPSILTLFITVLLLFFSAGGLYAQGQELPFPTYGTGSVQVRLYTDYFCPPCRAMEPSVEPLLKDLLKRNVITLTLVDVPYSRNTPLYAKYFLYALKERNDVEHAFQVRNILLDETTNAQMSTEERLAELFKGKSISYTVFDAKPAFDRFNALIKEDKIQSTPTCIIIRDGKKEQSVGGPDIIGALKRLL